MGIKDRIEEDLIRALKARDVTTLATLRLLKAAAKNAEVAKRAPLTDAEYEDVITRQAKLRREAIVEYDRGGRKDRAEQERSELEVLQAYLPQPLAENEVQLLVDRAVADSGALGPGDLGKVMSLVMPTVRGRADGAQVNRLVRAALARHRQ